MRTTTFYQTTMSMILVLVMGVSLTFAQNGETYNTYKGVLKDSKSKNEIVFATISVPGTHIGTVSNSDGEFTLKIQKSLNATELIISHLGYLTKTVSLADLKKGNENEILVDPSSVEIKEITIRPENAQSIVQGAIYRIPENYSNKASMQTGFYRETVKQRRDYLSISEGVIDIYKTSYKNTLESDRVRIFKARKSSNVKSADTLMLKLIGGPKVTLLLDIARHPDLLFWEEKLNEYSFALEDIVSIDGKMNYVISFKQLPTIDIPLYVGKLYIETESLAITMAEFGINLDDKDKASQLFVKKKPAGVKITPVSTSYLVTFKEQDGKYYFNYARNELSFKCNWRRKLFNSNYTVMSELAITDRDMENVSKFPAREAFKQSNVFVDIVTTYNDEDFWGEHNFIEPDQSIEAAIKKYGKKLRRQ
ncbi:MAG TPA: carboxypeptidase-like regulatory domain-containing protein [Tenuifilaceae bacterium]|nr:carboxypeptidase-like regulatory domain-containing protein [Tenuifilaceae bacterium]HPE17746.1 carboxypeptidase-like regulatory domain-containing protein [Tenuifilaceae bacterium]HPJ46429.1 carboxypeptidase-like regulatory domain-containing protein [Tenuifilaceae bacterium]HPQ34988.1 carboxypeptidase-like regulatory domain-containing protein [Tenuifilaceae bacterium]HRX68668.1 carboxypeptidase-like regulatory domain-containing protein [Tenuifilaceae bacterium]